MFTKKLIMCISKFKIHRRHFFRFVAVSMILFVSGCNSDKSSVNEKDYTDQLKGGADMETIVEHLIKVRKGAGVTRALALHYPDLDKEEAYKIQMMMLSKLEQDGEKLAGWKMGGAGVNDFNPLFGFMLASGEVKSGGTVSGSGYVGSSPLIEAEVGFLLKKDLPGPVTTMEQLIDAIEGVGGFSELISLRVRDTLGSNNATPAQNIADGLSNGGFIRPNRVFPLETFNYKNEKARVEINGKTLSEGNSNKYKLVDAVLFLANELPKYGRHLHTGDIVITGSILDAPPAKAGDEVKIIFSDFGQLSVKFE